MRLLFVTSNRLGDAILSTGVLAHFIAQNPGVDVTVVCGKVPGPLFRAVPGLAEIIAVEKQALSTHWLGAYGKLMGRRWDVIVDLRRVAIFNLLLAKKRLVSNAANFSGHKLEEFAALLGGAEIPVPVIWLDDAARATAAELIPALEDDNKVPTIALGATTGPRRKRWRMENYAAVMKDLTGPGGVMAGGRIVLFGAPNERDQAVELLDLLPEVREKDRTIDLVGKTDVLTGAAALGRCDFYLGVDSGLMHLAAAMGLPTLGIFGEHGVPQTYRPWGSEVAHVHKRNPDFSWDDRPSAMDGVKPADVTAAATELAKRAGI